jgi:hypothetical protein
VDWVIIKLVSSSDNNSEGKVDVLLNSLSPSQLPINKAILTHDDLVELNQVCLIVSQELSKRVKMDK